MAVAVDLFMSDLPCYNAVVAIVMSLQLFT